MNVFTLALGPVVAILFFLWIRNRYGRQNIKYLLWTLGAGVLSAVPVVIVEMLWVFPSYEVSALSVGELAFVTFVAIGLTEEFFKGAAFFATAYWSARMREPYHGIMYGVAAALGFAAIENVMYVAMGGTLTAVIRAVTAIPAHAMFGLFIGYFAGLAKFTDKRWSRPFLILAGFLLAVFMHGLYDFAAMFPYHNLAWLWIFPLLGAMVGISFLMIRHARRIGAAPAAPVHPGSRLPPKDAEKLGIGSLRKPPSTAPGANLSDLSERDGETKANKEPYFLDDYFKPVQKRSTKISAPSFDRSEGNGQDSGKSSKKTREDG